MNPADILLNLIKGFWANGFVSLCKTVLEHWIISIAIIALIAYLCSDSATEIYAWFLIGIFAFYSAVKALIEIFLEIKNYLNQQNAESKTIIIRKIGGKIFDFSLCAVGIFQSLKILTHISKISKSASSAINVVDDVASAVSKFLSDFKK